MVGTSFSNSRYIHRNFQGTVNLVGIIIKDCSNWGLFDKYIQARSMVPGFNFSKNATKNIKENDFNFKSRIFNKQLSERRSE